MIRGAVVPLACCLISVQSVRLSHEAREGEEVKAVVKRLTSMCRCQCCAVVCGIGGKVPCSILVVMEYCCGGPVSQCCVVQTLAAL